MLAGSGKRYEIHFPDGGIERGLLLGPAKEPEEVIRLASREWRITRAVEVGVEDIDYELHVEAVDEP
jgi:hypothetical protein